MLHIILMILKILGILILSILGLGLCIGLFVLFCPIRYYLEGSIYGKLEGRVRVSWLFRLICATFSYQENRIECNLRILGIRLKQRKKRETLNDLEQTAEKGKKRRKKKTRKEENQIVEETDKDSESIEPIQGIKTEKEERKLEEIRLEERRSGQIKIKETKEEGKLEEVNSEGIKLEEIESEKEETWDNQDKDKRIEEKRTKCQEQRIETEDIIEISKESEKKTIWKYLKNIYAEINAILTKIRRAIIKIKQIFIRIKGIPAKIIEKLAAVKTRIQKFFSLLKNLNTKRQAVLAFVKDEKNKEAIRYAKGKLFRLLCYILPRKVTLKLHYGFDDPSMTGILTGIIFMCYPKSAEKFQLMPDFENRILEGTLTAKGRVRLIRVLCTALSIYFHKECNRIIKMIIKMRNK